MRLRLRIYRGGDIALGPGKADLLAAIGRSGSIQAAAESMGMSYMRAWSLVRTMNGCFEAPLVRALRGGRAGGSAALTALGREILRHYRRSTADSLRAARPTVRKIVKRLKP